MYGTLNEKAFARLLKRSRHTAGKRIGGPDFRLSSGEESGYAAMPPLPSITLPDHRDRGRQGLNRPQPVEPNPIVHREPSVPTPFRTNTSAVVDGIHGPEILPSSSEPRRSRAEPQASGANEPATYRDRLRPQWGDSVISIDSGPSQRTGSVSVIRENPSRIGGTSRGEAGPSRQQSGHSLSIQEAVDHIHPDQPRPILDAEYPAQPGPDSVLNDPEECEDIPGRYHPTLRPFQCPFANPRCDHAFNARSQLNRHHSRVHANYRPHHCEYCPRRFASRSDLKRHVRTVHGLRID